MKYLILPFILTAVSVFTFLLSGSDSPVIIASLGSGEAGSREEGSAAAQKDAPGVD
jgi:hypothetical protein